MITDWLMDMRDFGDSIYAVFILPGDFLLSLLAEHLPLLASMLGVDSDDHFIILSTVVALLSWIFAAIVVWGAVRLVSNISRTIGAGFRTLSFRVSLALGNFKTRIVCKFRAMVLRRWPPNADSAREVRFSDLDMAVLQSAAACGPGFATSAPELAEQLMMRPAQIQRSLDKLKENKLLDSVIGSTDGFDNYRLSLSGTAFIMMLERRQDRVPPDPFHG